MSISLLQSHCFDYRNYCYRYCIRFNFIDIFISINIILLLLILLVLFSLFLLETKIIMYFIIVCECFA